MKIGGSCAEMCSCDWGRFLIFRVREFFSFFVFKKFGVEELLFKNFGVSIFKKFGVSELSRSNHFVKFFTDYPEISPPRKVFWYVAQRAEKF